MKKLLKIFFVILFIQNNLLIAQAEMELFPAGLNIQPLTANFLEPKLGFLFQVNNNELRLDVGNSMDIIKFNFDNNSSLSFGADLFTYTLLRGEKDFHFPVDAVDYLFGINAGYKKNIAGNEYGIRFRLSHISAHFVDGHFNNIIGTWRDSLNPKVYSREFFEFIPYYTFNDLRLYAGYTYIYHIDPASLGKNIFQLGFDYFFNNILTKNIHPFIGYDLRAAKIEEYSVNHSLVAGMKIGYSRGKGLSIYYNYYSGKSIHGEYFNFTKNYSAVGINLDL